ncbi:MAG: DUF2505 domain-containing protein [Varibaculum sp.]|nr:DUF2505 domain-containing protein [Varibaculum sp.]
MRFSVSANYPAEPEQVAQMLLDETFHRWRFPKVATEFQIFTSEGTEVIETRAALQVSELDPRLARALPGTVNALLIETLGDAPTISISIAGVPITMTADAPIRATATGSKRVISGQLRVNIPIFGNIIEQSVIDHIGKGIALEEAAAEQYFAGKGNRGDGEEL